MKNGERYIKEKVIHIKIKRKERNIKAFILVKKKIYVVILWIAEQYYWLFSWRRFSLAEALATYNEYKKKPQNNEKA